MATAEPRSGEDTKATILRISCGLFAARGYEAVGISEICTACGITKPSLYYHFDSKEGLLSAVLQRAEGVFFQRIGGTPAFTGDLVGDIRRLFSATYAFAAERPDEYRVLTAGLFSGPESELRRIGLEVYGAIIASFREFFRRAAGAHGNLQNKEALLAAGFLAQSLAMGNLLGEDPPSEDDLTRIVQTFMYGIF
jgi:AcrR family transcriptional regulator